jgi:hypothetical protein
LSEERNEAIAVSIFHGFLSPGSSFLSKPYCRISVFQAIENYLIGLSLVNLGRMV